MVVKQSRGKLSAKNRLKNRRVTVPADLCKLDLPAGCPVNAKDLHNLAEGASSLEQLCAVKAIVTSMGASLGKEVAVVDPNMAGFDQIAMMLLRLLLQSGSKPVHDPILSFFKGVPDEAGSRLVTAVMPELISSKTHETLIAAGTLCSVPYGPSVLAQHFDDLMAACVGVVHALVDSVIWEQANSVAAKVTEIAGGSEATAGDEGAGEEEEAFTVADATMLANCIHALQEVLLACPARVDRMIAAATGAASDDVAKGTCNMLIPALVALMRNEAMRKDGLTSASIVLCSLAMRSVPDCGDAITTSAIQLSAIAGCCGDIDPAILSGLGGKTLLFGQSGFVEGAFDVGHAQMPPLARQALYRGVLSAGNTAALALRVFPEVDSSMGRQSLMFSAIFTRVCDQCAGQADLFLVCYALQTLGYCLGLVTETVKSMVESSSADFKPSTKSSVLNAVFERGINVIWPHCEDPFQGIADQAKDLFDKLIDLRELSEQLRMAEAGSKGVVEVSKERRQEIFKDLLQMAANAKPNRKARYRVLTAIVGRVGCEHILATSRNFVTVLLEAAKDQSVGSCAGSLLLELLRNNDCSDPSGWWLQPCLNALTQEVAPLRYAMCNYVLPTLARAYPGSVQMLLDALTANQSEGQEVMSNLWAITAVIKISRRWGAEAKAGVKAPAEPVGGLATERFLRAALLHVSDDMRLNALEMICVSNKSVEPLTVSEVDLVKEFLSYNMKSSSSFYRQRCMELLKKFFVRMRVSQKNIEGKADKLKTKKTQLNNEQKKLAQDAAAYTRMCDEHLAWLTTFLTGALYPGGSFERNIMALELYSTVIDVWMPSVAPHPDIALNNISLSEEQNRAILQHLFRPEAVNTVVNAIVNTFDVVRNSAFSLISRFPSPLPGLDTPGAVETLCKWAMTLVVSPRARESDAGALIIQLVHRKYVLGLGWYISPYEAGAPRRGGGAETPSLYFVRELLEGIRRIVESAIDDFEGCFASSFAQGAILCLRYVLTDVSLPSMLKARDGTDAEVAEWRNCLEGLIALMQRVAGIAIGAMAGCPPERVGGVQGDKPLVVGGASVSPGVFGTLYNKTAGVIASPHSNQLDMLSAMQRNNTTPANTDSEAEVGHTHVSSVPVNLGGIGGDEDGEGGGIDMLGPREQLLVVSCWLTLKEVALALGGAVSLTPLDSEAYMSRHQLVVVGNSLLDIIFSTLHNGAIEKARLGFQKHCERLLRCKVSTLRRLPGDWLDHLLGRLHDYDVPVVRRSSQLSFSILAILDAEPYNTKRVLLEKAMTVLLKAAQGAGDESVKAQEGAVLRAQVHSLNILRHLFLDTNLAKEMATYMPQAMMCAVRGFGASTWAVRNSSTLAFSVLLNRSLGGTTQRKTFAASEFFLRYPTLCPFMLDCLVRATEKLDDESGGALELHPELQPILVLLAQLSPPTHIRADQEHLKSFIPILQRCSRYNNNMVRFMASRALIPFVPTHGLAAHIGESLLGQLPPPAAPSLQRAFAKHNEVHGLLEQVRCMFQLLTGGSNAMDIEGSWSEIAASIKSQQPLGWASVLTRLASMLPLWLSDDRIPPPISLSLLKCAGALLWSNGSRHIFRGGDDVASDAAAAFSAPPEAALLAEACLSACEALLARRSGGGWCPMLEALLGQASRCASRGLMARAAAKELAGEPGWVEDADSALMYVANGGYEVRWMALRGVKAAILARDGMVASPAGVRRRVGAAMVGRLVGGEDNGGCIRKVLRILLDLGGDGLVETVKSGSGGVLWTACVRLSKDPDARARERGLALSGHVLAELCGGDARLPREVERTLGEWLSMVEDYSLEDKHQDQRTAAADALRRSRVLDWAPASSGAAWEGVGGHALRAWMVSLRLLQDDDEEVRVGMARAVSRAVSGGQAGEDGVQPSKAIELWFTHSTRLFGDREAYHAFLLSHLEASGGGAGDSVADEVMSRRLFEKECDNFQAEQMLMCQCSAAHIKLLACGGSFKASVSRLRAFLEVEVSRIAATTLWAGGVSSRSDIFIEVYRLLLAVYASSPPPGEGGAEADEARAELTIAVKSLLAHGQSHALLRSALSWIAKGSGAADCEKLLAESEESRGFDTRVLFLTSQGMVQ